MGRKAKPTVALDINTLPELFAPIFHQAQFSSANHRKNVVALHKIHVQAAEVTKPVEDGPGIQLIGEGAFNKTFVSMLNHILPMKKGVTQADKLVKFVAAFLRYTSEKALEEKEEKEKAGEVIDEDEETTASRFSALMVKHLLKGFQAKDKNVRLRVVQCMAEMISSIGELDEQLYIDLKNALLERIRDKETNIRVHAVVALAKLQEGEEVDELEDGEQSLTGILIDVIEYDPAAEVRRAALLNMTPSKHTLDAIISRTRDRDDLIRKIVYSHVLPSLPTPKLLSIDQRETIIKNGLKDREATVRAAAGRLVGTWVDILGGDLEQKFLALLDLITREEVAQEALLSAFVTRPDLFSKITFGDKYYEELTPESAVLARVFVDHCISANDTGGLEKVLPVVTFLAFRIQHYYNVLLQQAKEAEDDDIDNDDRETAAEKAANMQLIVTQLLKIAVNHDFSDEVGRRAMFTLIREMLGQEALPEGLVAPCLDVLRKLSTSERDLIRLVVEIIQELRDLTKEAEPEVEKLANGDGSSSDGDESGGDRAPAAKPPREVTPETQARMESIDLRCLTLCVGMLERVNSTLAENSALHGLLPELIIPCVVSKDPVIRERGLVCLGLCGLIDKKIAMNSFQLFVQQAQLASEDIKKRCVETVFDLLMVYESDFFKEQNPESRIEDLLLTLLDQDSDEVQAIACEGVSKLMLSGIVAADKLLRSLVILYLTPETEDNQALRQCLSYFFPVYCYSSPLNQKRMQQVFLDTFWHLREHRDSLNEDQEMVPATQITLLFTDWTDPMKAVELKNHDPQLDIQADMAMEILKALLNKKFPVTLDLGVRADVSMTADDKKVLCQMLPKLHIPVELDQAKAKHLKLLCQALLTHRPLKDTTSRNAVVKFEKAITKTLAQQLESFNEDDYAALEDITEELKAIDLLLEDESDSEVEDLPHKARKVSRDQNPRVQAKRAVRKKKEAEELNQAVDEMLESDAGQREEDTEAGEVESALSIAGESDED